MNKELEYINEMYAELNDSGKWHKKVSKLKQSLTPPTEKELCKALSEYLNCRVIRYNSTFLIVYLKYAKKSPVERYKNLDLNSLIKAPHLITMIGRFYEEEIK